MRSLGVLTMVFALTAASPLFAQGRNSRYGAQGVPPGQMPPAGMCRVWYDGVPPGRQPRPTNCNEAERLASRDRNARVIYGDNNYGYNDRANNYPYGANDRYGYPNSNGRYGNTVNGVAYDKGYQDGLEKGRKDAADRNSYDPVRHSWYRSGDRGYNSRYGTRDSYKLVYRDGFEAGYDQAYRSVRGGNYPSSSRGGGLRVPWPF